MNDTTRQTFELLKSRLRRTSLAQIGGFRPPDDPRSSWFGHGVCLPGESLPRYNGRDMFPLLQININELPFVPQQLAGIQLAVLFHNREAFPFGKPHGEGWLIREYQSVEGLVPLPASSEAEVMRPFPIKWALIEDDAPGWEDAWEIVDLSSVNEDEEATDAFFDNFNRYSGTKVGGFPCEIQHGVGIEDFVFQVGSEEKPRWMWADNGIAYYFKGQNGEWRWDCQFY